MAGQPFTSAKDVKYMTHGSTQSCQQKPGIEMELSRKVLWKTLLPNSMNRHDIHKRPIKFREHRKAEIVPAYSEKG